MRQESMGPILRVNLLLAGLGAAVGILASIPITWLGKIVAGAPDPATLANYLWNMKAFGLMGAVFGPVLGWSTLRRVPLWRAAVEPAAGAVVGALIGCILGSPVLFLLLAGVGIAGTSWRLNRAYSDRTGLPPVGQDDPARLKA